MNHALRPRFSGIAAVRADADNPVALVNQIKSAFEAFKAENDKQISDIRKGLGDVVQAEKVDRINTEITGLQKALDELNVKMAAGQLGGAGKADPAKAEHKNAFGRFFRKGTEAGLRELEVKAKLTTQSDPDGGYVVPEEMEAGIDRVLGTMSAMRSLATVRRMGAPTYKKLVNMGGASAGWVGENDARPETSTPRLGGLEFTAMELYAQPAATQTMLDDGDMDIEAWLADEVSIAFSEQEGAAFIAGDGNKKPKGLLAYDTVANANYAWGKIGFIASGVSGGLTDGTHNGADALIDLYYALKAGYRNGAAWLMSDAVMGTVRKFKDGDGNYLWAAPTAAAELPTMLGKPVQTDDNMPAIAANKFPIAFGDFKRGYLILDRVGVRVLRDPYTSKPNVLFYTTKRVAGGVQNYEAIKFLKVA
ncbi:phage major capsid protein [Azospirillum thermophilum]|uniref:Phage major capsid protein n=1 Tax=Azospirillum thermophilum TaxID=2202148 RepID=A0A2S2CKQ8_9PROT|nr:phage major capsid protein [Azospirillum thermophilum]AWK85036.1 phage major capsid protein [Azospirillum thermophilum]